MTQKFPEFSLSRLLKTVFEPKGGERIAILIDLEDPKQIADFQFLENKSLFIQRNAYEHFYQALKNGVMDQLGLKGGDIFAYKLTGGSNLDLPDDAYSPSGAKLSLEGDIYPNFDIILCISTYSATAPLTAFAKKYNFRGATLHGVNEIILSSGLAVDYNEVSKEAEKLRSGMTKADAVEIDFDVLGEKATLRLELGKQEAQKSHGLCRGTEPDVANLPAGEVYYVPRDAQGAFPLKHEDGTIGLMTVENCRITAARLLKGDQKTLDEYMERVAVDPLFGTLGELGFGTQALPVSGQDIQDEKILGTMHVATGRSDHLGGDITPDRFHEKSNASHEDILFAPHKTPEVQVPQVRMYRDGKVEVLIENFKPAAFMQGLLAN